MTRRQAIAIAAALGLAGCASPYAQEAAFAAGWRAAEVIEVGTAAALTREVSRDCRNAAPHAPDAAFAMLRYEAGSRHHRVEASTVVPADAGLRTGERVYVNINDCAALPVAGDDASERAPGR